MTIILFATQYNPQISLPDGQENFYCFKTSITTRSSKASCDDTSPQLRRQLNGLPTYLIG